MKLEPQWYFKVRPTRNETGPAFIAWAARTPELGDGPLDLPSYLDVHVEFGATAEEAMRKLKAEVLS